MSSYECVAINKNSHGMISLAAYPVAASNINSTSGSLQVERIKAECAW